MDFRAVRRNPFLTVHLVHEQRANHCDWDRWLKVPEARSRSRGDQSKEGLSRQEGPVFLREDAEGDFREQAGFRVVDGEGRAALAEGLSAGEADPLNRA